MEASVPPFLGPKLAARLLDIVIGTHAAFAIPGRTNLPGAVQAVQEGGRYPSCRDKGHSLGQLGGPGSGWALAGRD